MIPLWLVNAWRRVHGEPLILARIPAGKTTSITFPPPTPEMRERIEEFRRQRDVAYRRDAVTFGLYDSTQLPPFTVEQTAGERVEPAEWLGGRGATFGPTIPDADGSYWFEVGSGFPIYNADGTILNKRIQYRCIGHEDGQMVIQARYIDPDSPREAERFGERIWE